jgi:hypothetical protein
MAQPYADDLQALAEELQEIAVAPPESAMMSLGRLVDYADEDGALSRLRVARQVAAQSALDRAGSQAKLARALGVSQNLVSRIIRGVRRKH